MKFQKFEIKNQTPPRIATVDLIKHAELNSRFSCLRSTHRLNVRRAKRPWIGKGGEQAEIGDEEARLTAETNSSLQKLIHTQTHTQTWSEQAGSTLVGKLETAEC